LVTLCFQGSVAGFMSGGGAPGGYTNTIDKFPFAADTNATDVGDLVTATGFFAGNSSSTSGYKAGGFPRTPTHSAIENFLLLQIKCYFCW
jgi:hypothetical protein